nr:immunoglobulin light chain junction region [Macaca mulatta]MOW67206.1 immunoglobulin light chain junction region [Macaca mulatta]MOW67924.1 immunoglobulin light chain junction region [Macaca mulatta]MOW72507.1 immunoglobulin light chain junction region [Macaca mulatta]
DYYCYSADNSGAFF